MLVGERRVRDEGVAWLGLGAGFGFGFGFGFGLGLGTKVLPHAAMRLLIDASRPKRPEPTGAHAAAPRQ